MTKSQILVMLLWRHFFVQWWVSALKAHLCREICWRIFNVGKYFIAVCSIFAASIEHGFISSHIEYFLVIMSNYENKFQICSFWHQVDLTQLALSICKNSKLLPVKVKVIVKCFSTPEGKERNYLVLCVCYSIPQRLPFFYREMFIPRGSLTPCQTLKKLHKLISFQNSIDFIWRSRTMRCLAGRYLLILSSIYLFCETYCVMIWF